MGLPPNTRRYFAEKHLEAAYKHLASVEENLFKESLEDRRAFEKFYDSLALFSGGTIALSITYLGYLKTTPIHRWLLLGSWGSLFVCLLCSLIYVVVNLHYSHHFREREFAEARKKKFETEADEIQNMDVVNIRTAAELAAYENPRREAARIYGETATGHKGKEGLYLNLWRWSGRIAQLSFAAGIGMLLTFAVCNS